MTILLDPEHNESKVLFSLPIPWTGASVLEIGSGDGRLTWRYADKVARVIGLEPDEEKYKAGLRNYPNGFEHVEFLNLGLDEFHQHVILSDHRERRISNTVAETLQSPDGSFRVTQKEKFALAILSWSL